MKIHLDIDCFFVSAERVRDSGLCGKNVVVVKGSDNDIFSKSKKRSKIFSKNSSFSPSLEFVCEKKDWKEEFIDKNGKIHGIVIAKSYEAKRYGIKTGTPLIYALRVCKDLHVLKSDHLYYQHLSNKLRKYLEKKIPILEQYSIDEFFGDLSGWVEDDKTYEFLVGLQNEIWQKFRLPISFGASRSKWIAKLATTKAKPYGIKVVMPYELQDFTKDILIGEFPGIGSKMQQRLHEHKIYTLSQLQNAQNLLASYGKVGRDLYKKINGIDNEVVEPKSSRQGLGIGRNFEPIKCRNELKRRVCVMARYISFMIVSLGLNPLTYSLKLKFEKGLKSSSSTTINRVFSERLIMNILKDLFDKLDVYPYLKIYHISINVSNFVGEKNHKTYSIIDFEEDIKMQTLSKSICELRNRHGVDILKNASEIL